MPKKHKNKHYKKRKEDAKQKWYYDACALDLNKGIYGEMINCKEYRKPYISHLSLGEAYGNCLKKKKDAPENFINLIDLLEQEGMLNIVGNDGIEKIFNELNEEFDRNRIRIDITDLIHLATAIHKGCTIFKTIDPDFDFSSENKKKVGAIANKYGIPHFSIKIQK